MNKPVLHSVDPRGVATVTLNRPEVNNAYDGALIQGLHDAMDELAAHRAVEEAVLERLVVQHAAKRRSAEATEGLASFAEKRPARWPG